MLPGVEEVIVNTGVRLAAQSAVASVKSAGRKKSMTEVLVTDLGGEPELNKLTNVVNLHLSRGAQWESRVRTQKGGNIIDITTKSTRGGSWIPVEGDVTGIEVWQHIPWWRRWCSSLCLLRQGRRYQVVIPNSGVPLHNMYSLAVIVVPSKWRCGGFYIQASLMGFQRPEDVKRWQEQNEDHLVDRQGLLDHPLIWRHVFRWRKAASDGDT